MNRKTLNFTYRIAATLLLSSIFTFALVLTRSAASEQVDKGVPNQTSTAEAEEPTSVYQPKRNAGRETSSVVLRAEKRGFPLINLQDGKHSFQSFLTIFKHSFH